MPQPPFLPRNSESWIPIDSSSPSTPLSEDADEDNAQTIKDVDSLKNGIIKTSKNEAKAVYNIVLLGETGVGKSTFLELITSVLAGKRINPYNPDVVDHTIDLTNENQTDSAHLYELVSKNGIVVRILDTPGFTSTRQNELDMSDAKRNELHKRSIVTQIKKQFDSLTVVLVLVNGTVPYVTVGTDYTLSMLSTVFPNPVNNNLAFLFTNVSSPIELNFPQHTLPGFLKDTPQFLLDNPIALQKKYLKIKDDPGMKMIKADFHKAVKNSEQDALEMLVDFFDRLDSLEPQRMVPLNKAPLNITRVRALMGAAATKKAKDPTVKTHSGSARTTTETLRSSLHQPQGLLAESSPRMSESTERAVEKPIKYSALLTTESKWDRGGLDQTSVVEILDKFAAQGSEGAQKLAQEVIASFNLYTDVSEKARLLDLVDGLVVYCNDAFHQQLAKEGFFQTLLSDEKVQSDQKFRTNVQAHMGIWLGSLSGKTLEIASDVLRLLSDSSKGESPADRQPGSSNPGGPLDQLLDCGPRTVITFQTPKLEKQLVKFLLSSYIQAGDILQKSRRVKWFSLQAIHIARQAFHLIIQFNDLISPDGPTNEQYDEGMDLDDALEELEDKIDALEKLELDEAIQSEEDHKYDLARLYQIFFTTRDFYPNGRDYKTDPVLKRLVDLDHGTLILARRIQARDSHIEGFQDLEVHGKGNNIDQGPISDMVMSQAEPVDTDDVPAFSTDSEPPPTKVQQEPIATPGFEKENIALRSLKGDKVDGPINDGITSKYAFAAPREDGVEDDEEADTETINNVESLKKGIIKTLKNKVQADYTILLVGETCVGKSAFLEYLANVLIANNIDHYNFEILDHSNEQGGSSNQSQTNSARLYELTSSNGIVVRILDTPGLASTRGIEQDEIHKRNIASEIQKHINSVTAVLILANGTVPRITLGTDYALSTLSAILPKSLAENIAFVFTNVPSPYSWNFSADTIPDSLREAEQFILDNPVALQKKYLVLKDDSNKKKMRMVMRKAVLAGEERALEMVVKLFDWLDGLGSQPATEIVYLYNMSQSIEAMIANTLAQMDQAATKKAEIDKLIHGLKNNSKDTDIIYHFENTITMAVWKQRRSSTFNVICGQPDCYSNCHVDYKSNISHDLNGFFEGSCDKCNHSFWNHYRCRAEWEKVVNTQTSVDQSMKEWEAAKDGTEKTKILVAVRDKVLHDLDQIINGATNDLAQQVERYAHLSLSGSFSAQVDCAVRLLEQNYIGLEKKGVGRDHLQRVKGSLDNMTRKLDILNLANENARRERVEKGHW